MRYIIAILLPPLGLLLCGKVFQAIACFFLMVTVVGWPIGSIWSLLVVSNYYADQRNERLIRELRRQG